MSTKVSLMKILNAVYLVSVCTANLYYKKEQIFCHTLLTFDFACAYVYICVVRE